MPTSIEDYITRRQARIHTSLSRWLPSTQISPQRLHQAMHYAVLQGGKRVRLLLVYASGEIFSCPLSKLDILATAVEYIHAYSLIHDDLPAMDDDDYRRGQPSCHRAFDEATAILAGDALQSLAFTLLSNNELLTDLDPKLRLTMIEHLAQASGSLGMAGGQALDLAYTELQVSQAMLTDMFARKTGALIQTSVCLGALCHSDLLPQEYQKLHHYGSLIGLAFQIQDDIFDTNPADSNASINYVHLYGARAAQEEVLRLHEQALACLEHFDLRADPLRNLTRYLLTRKP